MNKDLILRVAEALETHAVADLGFSMASFASSGYVEPDLTARGCGTTACIAGWTVALVDPDIRRGDCWDWPDDIETEARQLLELDYVVARELFYGGALSWSVLVQRSPQQAARVLRHLAKTGVVNWELAR